MRNRMKRHVRVKGTPVIPLFASVHGFFSGILRNENMCNAYIARMTASQGSFAEENQMQLERVTADDRQESARLTEAIAARERRLAQPPAYEKAAVDLTLKQMIRAMRRDDRERLLASRDIHAAREELAEIDARISENERVCVMRLEKSRHLTERVIRAYLAGAAVFFRQFTPASYAMSLDHAAYAAGRAGDSAKRKTVLAETRATANGTE